jgi:hypothetical protein
MNSILYKKKPLSQSFRETETVEPQTQTVDQPIKNRKRKKKKKKKLKQTQP